MECSNFVHAYECMGMCVSRSPKVFGKRARPWLRMGEACVGVWNEIKEGLGMTEQVLNEESGRIELRLGQNDFGKWWMSNSSVENENENEHENGSEESIKRMMNNPLKRAIFCFNQADKINKDVSEGEWKEDVQVNELLNINKGYCHLELGDYKACLEACGELNDGCDGIVKETAKFYICEANCMLGKASGGLEGLLGGGYGNGIGGWDMAAFKHLPAGSVGISAVAGLILSKDYEMASKVIDKYEQGNNEEGGRERGGGIVSGELERNRVVLNAFNRI